MKSQELVDYDWVIPFGRPSRSRLHHMHVAPGWDEDYTSFEDVTATCGRLYTAARIPGFFERQAVPRCAACCRALGYPQGIGSPKNDPRCRALLGLP